MLTSQDTEVFRHYADEYTPSPSLTSNLPALTVLPPIAFRSIIQGILAVGCCDLLGRTYEAVGFLVFSGSSCNVRRRLSVPP